MNKRATAAEWSGSPCPADPDNFWIDDATGERVDARTGKRSPPIKAAYPFQVEERVNDQWIPTKRFKTHKAADAYCNSALFPARIAAA